MSAPDRDPFALARADAELIEAEREFRDIERQFAALLDAGVKADEVLNPVLKRRTVAMDRIALMAPASIVGCAIKLRTLRHPDVGMAGGESEHDLPSLHQILAALERESADATRGNAH
ncbi:MAG TPA: hypothetical protein VFX06_10735 [Stellaceae bacterium]|nr:hypothetical protein [Stellaceae bacterium]